MAEYVGIDVSLEEVWLCVMDEPGDIVSEGKVVSDPDAIRDWLLAHAPRAIKIGIETGPTSTWLWHALKARDLPVICVDARHAKRVLSLQLVMKCTPRRPRATRLSRKVRQWTSASERATETPNSQQSQDFTCLIGPQANFQTSSRAILDRLVDTAFPHSGTGRLSVRKLMGIC
jgi:hypothetical protein